MHHHRWLLLRIVVVLTLKVKIRVVRKYEREPDCASNPAPLLARVSTRSRRTMYC